MTLPMIRFYTYTLTFIGLIMIFQLKFAKTWVFSIFLIFGPMRGPEVIEGAIFRQNASSMTPLRIESYCYIHFFSAKLIHWGTHFSKIIFSRDKNWFLGIQIKGLNFLRSFIAYKWSLSSQLSPPQKKFSKSVWGHIVKM